MDIRTRHHIEDLRLGLNGEQDADPENQIVPFTTDPSYDPFMAAVLAQDDFGHELFPYDWRKSLQLSTGALRALVLNLYSENGHQPIHLVAHSMGGLMVRAALMDHGHELWPKIGRIVFIATPHYGSPAIAGYLKNHMWGFDLMAVLGLYLSRDTFRSLWGVLSMMPAPRGVYPGTRSDDAFPWQSGDSADSYIHPCANFDMYKAENWKLDLTQEQTSHLQNALSGAVEFHRCMYDAHQALTPDLRNKMVVIAGVGYQTLFRAAYEPHFFGLWERMEKVTSRIEGDRHREGDGRVPLASVELENVEVHYIKGIHGGLPNIPEVYNDVFRWLRGENMKLPDTVNGALSSHLGPQESVSEAPSLDGTLRSIKFTDDPGLWDVSPPDPVALEALKAKLEAELLPEFTRVRLL